MTRFKMIGYILSSGPSKAVSSSTRASSSLTTLARSTSLSHQQRLFSTPFTTTFKVAKVSVEGGKLQLLEVDTPSLLKHANIYARDLFTLNMSSRQERPSRSSVRRTLAAIVPRPHPHNNILVSFGNVRAVVTLDHIFLLDAQMPAVQDFALALSNLYKSSSNHDTTWELVFLEEVLYDTVQSYNRRLRLYEPIVDSFLDKVANEVYSDTGVHLLVPLKDSLQSFELQVKQTLDCLTNLVNDDEQMLDLLLTEQEKASEQGTQVDFQRHEDVELLLGVYARQIANVSMEISYLIGRLQSKQEFVSLALAGYRNRMIRMNVHIGIAGLSLGLGTAVAGFFGMNVINGLEGSTSAFTSILLASGIGGAFVTGTCINYLSGNTMRLRAAQRLEEIETLSSALSDMCALDYTIKKTVESQQPVGRDQFRSMLRKARQSKKVTKQEVDLLFDVFDRVKDDSITRLDLDESHFHSFAERIHLPTKNANKQPQ